MIDFTQHIWNGFDHLCRGPWALSPKFLLRLLEKYHISTNCNLFLWYFASNSFSKLVRAYQVHQGSKAAGLCFVKSLICLSAWNPSVTLWSFQYGQTVWYGHRSFPSGPCYSPCPFSILFILSASSPTSLVQTHYFLFSSLYIGHQLVFLVAPSLTQAIFSA